MSKAEQDFNKVIARTTTSQEERRDLLMLMKSLKDTVKKHNGSQRSVDAALFIWSDRFDDLLQERRNVIIALEKNGNDGVALTRRQYTDLMIYEALAAKHSIETTQPIANTTKQMKLAKTN